jgi:hypothetical protein
MIEDRLARLLDGGLSVHVVAKNLVQAMEQGIIQTNGTQLAPDRYLIVVNSSVLEDIEHRYPDLGRDLGEHLVALAAEVQLQIKQVPEIRFVPDDTLLAHEIRVKAEHTRPAYERTQVMTPVDETPAHNMRDAHLVIDSDRLMPLTETLINIGRHIDNHIVLDQPTVSRRHCQLKWRFGHYVVYDLHSKAGTFVNSLQIQEHRLKSGDVIHVGNARLVYIEEDEDTRPRLAEDTEIRDPDDTQSSPPEVTSSR